MNTESNNYIKILEYLAQFIGDGKYYQVTSIIPSLLLSERQAIIEYLIGEGFVSKKLRTGASRPSGRRTMAVSSFEELGAAMTSLRNTKSDFVEYELMITLKGVSYLDNLRKVEIPKAINIHLERNENSIVNKGDNITQSGSFDTSKP